jgi:hypothetical protein
MNGDIYTHGANEWGQLGIDRIVLRETQPVLLNVESWLTPGLYHLIPQIEARRASQQMVTDSNNNNSSNNHNSQQPEPEPETEPEEGKSTHIIRVNKSEPSKFQIVIQDITCGIEHSIFLTSFVLLLK